MSYNTKRISEQLRVLRPAIDDFIVRYNAWSGPIGGGPRQTVFLFPGGMASRLVCATTPYQPGGDDEIFDYETLWLTVPTFLEGRARDLKLTKAGLLDYRDKQNKIIVADGLINLLGVSPYTLFTLWCELMHVDYFVFPWDWRRAVWDIGDLFIRRFLPHFRTLVMAGCNNADPLARFSLVGHSAGGMVANWALRSGAAIMAGLDKAITVGTPFYGYSGQLHRWFDGEQYFNGPGDIYKAGMISAICSFPACYAWMFMPQTTFGANQAAFAADPNYPLLTYPSVDETTAAIADPYLPQTFGSQQRYPSTASSGFNHFELAVGQFITKFLSSPLGAKANQFWNIRGDTQAGNTITATTWDWVPPTSPCPVTDVSVTGGDGVHPGWTARHLDLDQVAGHVITIRSPLAAHAFLLDEPLTVLAIAGILGIP